MLLTITTVFANLVKKYGYLGIFLLMILESASFPIPSEVILPVAGVLIANHLLNAGAVLGVAIIAGLIGFAIDYYIAYFLGKDVVYKHLQFFRVKKTDIEAFDRWFNRNGSFAVFVFRMLPEVRGLISLPAGFARMPKGNFFLYSALGSLIWDVALLAFGYYALSISNAYVVLASIFVFAIAIYILYRVVIKKMRK